MTNAQEKPKEEQVKVAMSLAVAVIALMSAGTTSIAAEELSAEREQAIKLALNAAMDQYVAWFAAGRADLIAERSYLSPSVRLEQSGPSVLASPDDIKKRFEATLTPLIADGYAKSEWPLRNICVLSEAAAIVSGRYVRYRKDGRVMGEYGATYMFAKTDDGWRIVAFTPHDPSRVFRCCN